MEGWVCPLCGRVYGPYVIECSACNELARSRNVKTSTSTVGISDKHWELPPITDTRTYLAEIWPSDGKQTGSVTIWKEGECRTPMSGGSVCYQKSQGSVS